MSNFVTELSRRAAAAARDTFVSLGSDFCSEATSTLVMEASFSFK